ncbi:FAD/NAD-P-binding domain-containing protein [Amylostereum chailletii]|nr:FAD/NAD-P-binding domain-containing protein [Amylostereum chailletii]
MASTSALKKDIVLVGGGGAGMILARALVGRLDTTRYTFTLINNRAFTVFLPTSVRMAATEEGHLEDEILLPYDRLLKDIGTLKVGKTVKIEEDAPGKGGRVVLADGETVHYDVLVLAPGTRLESPLDYPDSKEDVLRYIAEWRTKFRDATKIVMGGGGPTNVELAGEIKDLWPEKSVTIVQSRNLPFNDIYADRFRRRIAAECKNLGINFVFNDYLDGHTPTDGVVRTRKGKELPADLVITSHGGFPKTEFIKSLGDDVVTLRGLVRVKPTLEVPGHPGVFCIGDVIDNNERNRLAKYLKHAQIVEPTAAYGGSFETIRISLGKSGGVTYWGVLGGIVVGSWFTGRAQSRHLLAPQARRLMGY